MKLINNFVAITPEVTQSTRGNINHLLMRVFYTKPIDSNINLKDGIYNSFIDSNKVKLVRLNRFLKNGLPENAFFFQYNEDILKFQNDYNINNLNVGINDIRMFVEDHKIKINYEKHMSSGKQLYINLGIICNNSPFLDINLIELPYIMTFVLYTSKNHREWTLGNIILNNGFFDLRDPRFMMEFQSQNMDLNIEKYSNLRVIRFHFTKNDLINGRLPISLENQIIENWLSRPPVYYVDVKNLINKLDSLRVKFK